MGHPMSNSLRLRRLRRALRQLPFDHPKRVLILRILAKKTRKGVCHAKHR